ncbi:MAG: hypothetical protein WBB28_14585 [Crinalium sp.]|uniref:Uncharacterized protein n=1 Tax=Crinalium epipsammum PCC 9333 TaxID=1173022 RepID=K9VWE3_9CYAN|nr:hypothetical protein [Crinalium epipsammum]AFZ11480.1 hypothetical protein Cri9333_0524 [Crinalium epipsammum PCC 9333]
MSNQQLPVTENLLGDALACNYLLSTLPNCCGFINEDGITEEEKSSYKQFDKPAGTGVYAIAIGRVCILPASDEDVIINDE